MLHLLSGAGLMSGVTFIEWGGFDVRGYIYWLGAGLMYDITFCELLRVW